MKKSKKILHDEVSMLKRVAYNERSAKLNNDYDSLYEIYCGLAQYFLEKRSFEKAISNFHNAIQTVNIQLKKLQSKETSLDGSNLSRYSNSNFYDSNKVSNNYNGRTFVNNPSNKAKFELEKKLLYPLKLLGVIYQQTSGERKLWFKNSMSFHNKHLILARKLRIFTEVVDCLTNIGLTYFSAYEVSENKEMHKEKLRKARFRFNEALSLLQNFSKQRDNFSSFENRIFFTQIDKNQEFNKNKEKEENKKESEGKKEFEIEKRRVDVIINLGLVCKEEKRFNEAINFFNQSLKIAINIKYFKGEMLSYFNIGSILYTEKEYEKAINYLEKDREINEKKEYFASEVKTLTLLANSYIKLKELEKAKISLLRQNKLIETNLDKEEYFEVLEENEKLLNKVKREIESNNKIDKIIEELKALKITLSKKKGIKEEEECNALIKKVLEENLKYLNL